MVKLLIIAFIFTFNSLFLVGGDESSSNTNKRIREDENEINAEIHPKLKRFAISSSMHIPPTPLTQESRNAERIEDLAIRLIHEHKISEFAFNHFLKKKAMHNYKDSRGFSWWDHARAANNHVIMKVLQEKNLAN